MNQNRRAARMRQLLPYFNGSLGFSVFNSTEYDRHKARNHVVQKFGEVVYKAEVLDKMQTGVMEVFQHPPTRVLRHFVWHVALSVNRRCREKEKAG